MSKRVNLQPWLDYFDMLRTYKEGGLLELHTDDSSAYITMPAILRLAGCDEIITRMKTQNIPDSQMHEMWRTINGKLKETATRIRAYAMFLQAAENGDKGTGGQAFALHVVADNHPHDLCFTILVKETRSCRKLGRKDLETDIIYYQ